MLKEKQMSLKMQTADGVLDYLILAFLHLSKFIFGFILKDQTIAKFEPDRPKSNNRKTPQKLSLEA